MDTPFAFGCATCANSLKLQTRQNPSTNSCTLRARPRTSTRATTSDEQPAQLDHLSPPPPPPSIPWSPPTLRRPDPARTNRRAPSRALVTSVALNLNGREALPSIASLLRYMNDLHPKLDYLGPRARKRVLSALEVANVAHEGQKRKSGEPFIIHPVCVAAILADLRMDTDCIVAGLLHDTVEDTPITLEELELLFGHDVRKIVEGETKFSKLAKKVHCDKTIRSNMHSPPLMPDNRPASLPQKHDRNAKTPPPDHSPTRISSWETERAKREEEQQKQADNLRAMFVAMTEDVRVIIVKLADRLHNMRTLAHMSVAKQKKISKETLEFFAPLAHRLGMRRIKTELEELSFMYLYPEHYQQLKYEVETMLKRSRFHYYLKSAEDIVKEVLEEDRILYKMIRSVQVLGSTKELYSIYRRRLEGETLASMLDIATLRVVVDLDPGVSNQACYHVLGRIHAMWRPLPKRLKDYIAFPKPNGYQSLHTTVLLGQGLDFFAMEIQIRTAEMHRIAEEGIAAELFQPDATAKNMSTSGDDDSPEDSSMGLDSEWRRRTKGWLINIREYIDEFSSSRDLVDAVRRDLLGNRVFIFTPKGRIVDLPKDSTPVDVAYQIHSEVGHQMIGAKVNGRMVSLDYKLQNADVVKIIGSKSSPGPSSEWIGYAKSRTARQKIRQFLRARDRDNMLERGRSILEEAAKASLEPVPSDVALAEIMTRLSAVLAAGAGIRNVTTVDDLYIAIAKGHRDQNKMLLEQTVLALLRDRRHAVVNNAYTEAAQYRVETFVEKPVQNKDGRLLGQSTERVEVQLGSCCHPIRGDEVMGIYKQSEGTGTIMVHRSQCDHVLRELKKRPASGDVVYLKWANGAGGIEKDSGGAVTSRTSEHAGDGFNKQRVRPLQPTRLVLVAHDCDGLLSYICGVLASLGASIRKAYTDTDDSYLIATLAFEVLVEDTYHLGRIMERIEDCEEVESVRRIGPNERHEYFPEPKMRGCGGHDLAARELEIDES